MNYQPVAAKEYQTAAEMRAGYRANRSKLFDSSGVAAALRTTLELERRSHASEVAQLRAEIDQLRVDKAELVSRLSYEQSLKEEPAPVIDRVKYAFPRVFAAICRAHKLAPEEIRSTGRAFHLCRARMHLVNVLTIHRPDLSTPAIGALIGRDHTTVINARYRWPHIRHKVAWAIVAFEREINKEDYAPCG